MKENERVLTVIQETEILGKKVNLYNSIDEPLFEASEVAGWLDVKNISQMLKQADIEETEKGIFLKYTLGGNQKSLFITEDAIGKIIEITKGYPFFIQQMCQVVYKNTNKEMIEKNDIENNVDEFFELLDFGFFGVRYECCSDGEKKFVFAMVSCGELPCTIANISKRINKKAKTISPTRAQLISKGIIFPVRYSELDFTVPEFSGYIRRLDEYQQWCKEN